MLIKAMYSIAEVAAMLGVSDDKVRYMVEQGHLDSERIGSRLFIPLSGLQARPQVWESIVLRTAYEDGGK